VEIKEGGFMPALFAENQLLWRLLLFGGVFTLMLVLETWIPRRHIKVKRFQHLTGNVLLSIISTVSLTVLFPLAAVEWAVQVETLGWGLLNIPTWNDFLLLGLVLSILILDLSIYWQHRLMHKVPVLWRLHRVHHTDPHLDVSSGIRFHPLEIIISMVWKFVIIALIGASPLAVFLFEVQLNAFAMFNHSNFKIPLKLDRWLRSLFVTPDMHRIHHSIHSSECNSNYGFTLTWWDFVFRSYSATPRDGQLNMQLGVQGWMQDSSNSLQGLLIQPFKSTQTPMKGEPDAL